MTQGKRFSCALTAVVPTVAVPRAEKVSASAQFVTLRGVFHGRVLVDALPPKTCRQEILWRQTGEGFIVWIKDHFLT
jgi:hypothetical protein